MTVLAVLAAPALLLIVFVIGDVAARRLARFLGYEDWPVDW